MKVFYINLKKCKDRRDHMEDMLSELNLDYERFEAICPTIKEIKFGKFKKLYEKASPRFKKYVNTKQSHPRAVGVFGVYISSLRIHQSQLENPEPYMILEDDVKITAKTLSQLNNFISNEKYKDWDIIRSLWESTNEIEKIRTVHPESKFYNQYPTKNLFGGAHFSVFRNAKKILNYMSSENLIALDSVYSTSLLNVYHSKFDVELCPFGTNIPKINIK